MPRNRGFPAGQWRHREIGEGAFRDVPETNVGNIERRGGKATVAHRKGSNRGFRGFYVGRVV